MDTRKDMSAVATALENACWSVHRAHNTIADESLCPESAHAAVAGVHQLANTFAQLVGLLQQQLPSAVATSADTKIAAEELRADLRSLHGCVTTGMRLLEPALDDLHGLAAPARTERDHCATPQGAETASLHDVLDHHRSVEVELPETAGQERALSHRANAAKHRQR